MDSFLLLGTSSCEGIPAPFCECPLCTKARKEGGRDVRKRFSVLLNDETLIDFGPDIVPAFRMYGIDETKIRRLLFTHSHCDHCDPVELLWQTSYAKRKLPVIANETVWQKISEAAEAKGYPPGKTLPFEKLPAEPYQTVLHENWKIMPVRAVHAENGECALNFLIETPSGKKIFILSDTGIWKDESFRAVSGAMADAAVIEMSYGIHPPYDEESRTHLGAMAARRFLKRLQEDHALKANAVIATAHISHCSNTTYAELEAYWSPLGIRAGFDGMRAAF